MNNWNLHVEGSFDDSSHGNHPIKLNGVDHSNLFKMNLTAIFEDYLFIAGKNFNILVFSLEELLAGTKFDAAFELDYSEDVIQCLTPIINDELDRRKNNSNNSTTNNRKYSVETVEKLIRFLQESMRSSSLNVGQSFSINISSIACLPNSINFVYFGYSNSVPVIGCVDGIGNVVLWNVSNKDCKKIFFVNNFVFSTWGLATSRMHSFVAISANDHKIRIWNLLDTNDFFELNGHEHNIPCIHFSTDGNYLISTGIDCTTRIWDIFGSKSCIKMFRIPENEFGWSCLWLSKNEIFQQNTPNLHLPEPSDLSDDGWELSTPSFFEQEETLTDSILNIPFIQVEDVDEEQENIVYQIPYSSYDNSSESSFYYSEIDDENELQPEKFLTLNDAVFLGSSISGAYIHDFSCNRPICNRYNLLGRSLSSRQRRFVTPILLNRFLRFSMLLWIEEISVAIFASQCGLAVIVLLEWNNSKIDFEVLSVIPKSEPPQFPLAGISHIVKQEPRMHLNTTVFILLTYTDGTVLVCTLVKDSDDFLFI